VQFLFILLGAQADGEYFIVKWDAIILEIQEQVNEFCGGESASVPVFSRHPADIELFFRGEVIIQLTDGGEDLL
jgi:hypothetical protein